MEFYSRGKVKDLYIIDDDTLLFRFSDRVSAYDVKFNETIPKKGQVLCKFAEFWFNELDVPNHFIRRESDTEIIVKKIKMIPLECIVRGYFYGSLVDRYNNGQIQLDTDIDTRLAAKLPSPIFDPTTKSEHDIPVDRDAAIEMNLVTADQYTLLKDKSISIYNKMSNIIDAAGFILADLKLEFGILDDQIVLGDSIGPDECRLWPKNSFKVGKIQSSFDKQILRDWLSANGYRQQFESSRAAGNNPTPPTIPSTIISQMTDRYIESYTAITNRSL